MSPSSKHKTAGKPTQGSVVLFVSKHVTVANSDANAKSSVTMLIAPSVSTAALSWPVYISCWSRGVISEL